MTLLVVEEEETVVAEIREILGRFDDSIRIVGVTQDIVSVAGWLKKNTIPDLILVNEEVVPDLQHFHPGEAKAVVTFSTDSEAYNFQAFRFRTLHRILSKLPGSGDLVPTPLPPACKTVAIAHCSYHYRKEYSCTL
jgi:hypothetical protein